MWTSWVSSAVRVVSRLFTQVPGNRSFAATSGGVSSTAAGTVEEILQPGDFPPHGHGPQLHELRADPAALVLKDKAGDLLIEGGENKILPGEDKRDEPGIGERAVEDKVDQGVLLQSWAESSEDSVSHSLMAAACGRSQDVSKTRLTITASGFGCP